MRVMHVGTPWLTVIMPCFQGERWIDASLGSIVKEGSEGIEVLVIDGSPTPASRDIARSYSDRLRVRVLERSDLSSWQAKTNFGVEIAESSHICWLGVDDVWLPGRVAAARTWIAGAFNAPIHLGPCAIIDRFGRKLGIWRCPLPAIRELRSTEVTEHLLVQNFVAAPAPIFRRDAWLACGGLDETLWYTADWDIWLKLCGSGATYYHDAVTVGFRIHSESLTVTGSRDTARFSQQMQTVLDRHLCRLAGDGRHIERTARASIRVNTALVSASDGHVGALLLSAFAVLRLGPSGMRRYFRDSRLVERLVPRLRAKLAGAF